MKKKIALALAVIAVCAAFMTGCGSAKKEDTSAADNTENTENTENTTENTQIANPWTESDEDGVAEATGFDLTAPDGATDVVYSYMEDGKMAQMTYVLDNAEWTYRAQQADELTDISGLSIKWTEETEGTVTDREAAYYAGTDSDKNVQLVNWYDIVPGVTYSLSATGKMEISTADMQKYAEGIFVPTQGNAEGDTEDDDAAAYFVGEHKRSSDESLLTVTDNGDGTYKIDIKITKLCSLEDGEGTYADGKMTFTIKDPSDGDLTGEIYRGDGENTLTVKFTDSTWSLIPNDEVFEGFGE